MTTSPLSLKPRYNNQSTLVNVSTLKGARESEGSQPSIIVVKQPSLTSFMGNESEMRPLSTNSDIEVTPHEIERACSSVNSHGNSQVQPQRHNKHVSVADVNVQQAFEVQMIVVDQFLDSKAFNGLRPPVVNKLLQKSQATSNFQQSASHMHIH